MVQKRIVSSMLKTLKCPKPTNNQTNKKEKKPQNQKTKPTTKKKIPKNQTKTCSQAVPKVSVACQKPFSTGLQNDGPHCSNKCDSLIYLHLIDYISVLGSEPINSIYRTGFLVQLLLILVLTPRNQKVLFNLILQEFQRWSLR